MSRHPTKSPPPVTYTARPPLVGPVLTCGRCRRVHPFPAEGTGVRCECGWRYDNDGGLIREAFKPRLGA